VPEEVCLSTAGAVGLPLAGEGAHLQGCCDLKVCEAEGGLEWYGREPDPAALRGFLDNGPGLLWGQRAQQRLPVPRKDLLAALMLGDKLGAVREGFRSEDRCKAWSPPLLKVQRKREVRPSCRRRCRVCLS
jgi:hypothetical protein